MERLFYFRSKKMPSTIEGIFYVHDEKGLHM
jgi:hypothetical protein